MPWSSEVQTQAEHNFRGRSSSRVAHGSPAGGDVNVWLPGCDEAGDKDLGLWRREGGGINDACSLMMDGRTDFTSSPPGHFTDGGDRPRSTV